MSFPVFIPIGSLKLHPHLVFETLAYAIAFRVYLAMRKRHGDALDDGSRWWIVAAAAMGAVLGCKVLYWFEDPAATLAHWHDPAFLMGGKTIVGALIGGLFFVEIAKHHLEIKRRTGDLNDAPVQGDFSIQGGGSVDHPVPPHHRGLDHVAHLNIARVFHADTALVARGHVTHIVFETPQ